MKRIPSDTLKKLQVIKTISIETNQSNKLKPLVTKYGNTLKKMKLCLTKLSSKELKTCFAHISRFESLESLQIRVVIRTKLESIDEFLQTSAKKLNKLKKTNSIPTILRHPIDCSSNSLISISEN